MKKLVLAAIIAAVFVSGTIVGAMPFASANIVGPPDKPIIKQLNAMAKILTGVDSRLARVLGHIGPPEQPEIITALHNIEASCSSIIAQVETKLGTTSPP